MPDFQRAMENLKQKNEDAWSDMSNINPKQWTREAYDTWTLCDLQVNNMCEAFNKAILEWRDKPIITLIEGLKYYLTTKIVKQKEQMLRYRGEICPMIQQRLEFSKKAADKWLPTWHGDKRMTSGTEMELTSMSLAWQIRLVHVGGGLCLVSLADMQLHVLGLTTVSLRTL